MDKRQAFLAIIRVRENKNLLIERGIGRHAIRSWLYTSRVPSEKTAKKISDILGIPLSMIPYYRTEHVI